MKFPSRLLLPLLLLVVFLYAWRPIAGGEDFWAHAAIGRWALENGRVPDRTLFLWSADVPWIFHSYGAGILFALLLQSGGAALALVFNALMAAIPVALIWLYAKKKCEGIPPSLFAVLLLASLWPASVRWHGRPEMFTVLFLTLLFLFLLQKQRPLWTFGAVVGIFALWPNLHGGFPIGVVVLGLSALLESLQNRRFEWRLFVLSALCALVPFLTNPYGFEYARVFGGTAEFTQNVTEWLPFWVKPRLNSEVVALLIGLWFVAVFLWWRNPERRWIVLGWLLLIGVAFLSSRRHLWLASTTISLALATSAPLLNGEFLYRALKRSKDAVFETKMRLIGRWGAVLILISGALAAFPPNGFAPVSRTAPIQMAEFLAEEAPAGRIVNDYEYSAALEWFLNGRRDIYIDLINAYPVEIFHEYLDLMNAKPAGVKMLDERQIQLVALRPLNAEKPKTDPLRPLHEWLEKSPDWRLIYNERDGRVWTRRIRDSARPENQTNERARR